MDPLADPLTGLVTWSYSALSCTEHLLGNSDSQLRRDGDALLLMLSLRNIVRAVEWCATRLQDSAGQEANQALADFRSRLPGIVDARDILEHFDDYAEGRGRLQSHAVKAGRPAETYSFEVVPSGIDDFEVQVGGFSFSIKLIRDACRKLTITLLAAFPVPPYSTEAEALLNLALEPRLAD